MLKKCHYSLYKYSESNVQVEVNIYTFRIGLGSWDWRRTGCRESTSSHFPVFKNLTYLFIDFWNNK